MIVSAREHILSRLRSAPRKRTPPRPPIPPLRELAMEREALVRVFTENLESETGVVYRTKSRKGLLRKLGEVLGEEDVKRAIVTTDDVVAPLNLAGWGKKKGIAITTPADYPDREAFKDAVFLEAEAGITGVDFAVAESGTLVLVHGGHQARLVSLAPVLHVAVVPVERVVPVYEWVIEGVYGEGKRPSQTSWITGPSTSADIQARQFRGMHGPRKLKVILLG